MSNLAELRRLRGCPAGSAADWRARYATELEQIERYREVSAPAVSAVVVSYRRPRALLACLDSISAQAASRAPVIEVIVVDNGGPAPLPSELGARADLVLRMRRNVGWCRARNLAAAFAKADILAFLDDDGLVAGDYFRNALGYFAAPAVLAVRGRVNFLEHRYYTAAAAHYDRGKKPLEDLIVTEGNSLHRKQAFLAVGGFAENLERHEGVDYCYRLRCAFPDARFLYAPDVTLQHDYASSARRWFVKTVRGSATASIVPVGDADFARFVAQHTQRRFPPPDQPLGVRLVGAVMRGAARALRAAADSRQR